jgi:DNA repair protein RecO (recombination protein O)
MGRTASSEALLLDAFDLQDGDRIVTFLTPERGKKRGVARGAKRKYSRFAGQLQPLAKINVTWYEKEGRDLVRISDVELLRPAHKIQADLEGILLAAYLSEQMAAFTVENEPSETLYRLLDSTIEGLLAGADQNLAARYFESWLLRLSGIFPAPRECPLCGRPFAGDQPTPELAGDQAVLLPGADALLCMQCVRSGEGGGLPRRALRLGPDALELLRRFGRHKLTQLGEDVAVAPATLALIERLCGEIRRSFLGHELKSYEMMRKTFARLEKG